MINAIPPAAIFIIGALLVPLFRGRMKSAFLLAVPVLGLINLISIPEGSHWATTFMGLQLTVLKIDRLSLIFGYIFHIISFITLLYALKMRNDVEYAAGMAYAGSALGVIFAGDLFTLFCFWEMMTVSSVLLIWARKTESSLAAGFRYVVVHIIGGVILLFGILMYATEKGSLDLGYIGLDGLASYLIFIGVGINCAWPLLHSWLSDAYPEATIAGAVFLSAFTTKTAVYVLARTFPGADPLIWIGALMAAFPIFYAVIENDLRKVLAYSLINQVGFMVVGIGIGTDLSINGAVAHAFNDILFKALLFMSMGAVMFRTGKINATDLGGLYKSMPLTCAFCIVGAASISAFPLFSGFVSKSMVMSASAKEGFTAVWFILLFASAGVFHHAGIKIPFFAFFSHDSGLRVKEAPFNMLLAMGITAFLCVFIGSFPGYLYGLLPYPVDYVPYTASHVMAQLQLLFFSALAFTLLMLSGIYPAEIRAVNLDADWFYRKGARAFMWFVTNPMTKVSAKVTRIVFDAIPSSLAQASKNPLSVIKIASDTVLLQFAIPEKRDEIKARIKREKEIFPGDIIKHWPIGSVILWAILFLLIYLLIYYAYNIR
ncbi:MAG: Na(+)/H(+) antiporter subunit D [Nitrospirae bacterium GWF2_44_13]|nr:MAG: Na(+)/H(+) antiporter subunit D [Nitrospirae bacterium GWF2_44_13]OGW63638.1 MAG: Na(+)/H(+) antiporter subunit D [Nitrospirae bacterium RIFOXYA2_FULL_44_9]